MGNQNYDSPIFPVFNRASGPYNRSLPQSCLIDPGPNEDQSRREWSDERRSRFSVFSCHPLVASSVSAQSKEVKHSWELTSFVVKRKNPVVEFPKNSNVGDQTRATVLKNSFQFLSCVHWIRLLKSK